MKHGKQLVSTHKHIIISTIHIYLHKVNFVKPIRRKYLVNCDKIFVLRLSSELFYQNAAIL